jgi:transcription-repair coupling factor (superfamily II helicase)
MDLRELPALAEDLPTYHELKKQADAGGVIQVEGLSATTKSFLLAQLHRETGRPVVIITYNAETAQRFSTDLQKFGVSAAHMLNLAASTDTLIFAEGAPDLGVLGRRIAGLQAMTSGAPEVIVGPIGAFLQLTVPPEVLLERVFIVSSGETLEVGEIERRLTEFGYDRVEAVEGPGQWTRRGGIVDVFPGDAAKPFRIDFFGDEIESIRPFDVESQRSFGKVESATVRAVREIPLTDAVVEKVVRALEKQLPDRLKELKKTNSEGRGAAHAERLEECVGGDITNLRNRAYTDTTEYYLPLFYPEPRTALDYLPKDAILVLDEPSQSKARWEQVISEIGEIAEARAARGEWISTEIPHALGFDAIVHAGTHARSTVIFSLLGRANEGLRTRHKLQIQSGQMENFAGRLATFFEAVEGWIGGRFRVVLVSEQPEKIREVLLEHRIPAAPLDRLVPGGEGGVFVMEGNLASGFKLAEAALVVASHEDIFGHRVHHRQKKRAFKEGLKITSYLELRPGDYVVHIHHGIGQYAGITKMKGADGAERDYLIIEYEAPDRLFVPTDQVDRVQKYIGAQESPPSVTRLKTGEWARATERARKQVREMAADLIKLYATRQAAHGHSYPPDTPWQDEMEEAFVYEETPDQLAAIEDVKRDLESDKPMDRLICGDVGYGKTEVAIRAAFKVVNSQRQVAILCPTTILAQQHLATFRERLAAYPVSIEMLSRFVSKADTERTIKGLAEGTVDIVVGTHKLLGKTVKFQNLGLLVVDEEQRFGVVHKERIKALKKNVDVLTLTATPIPRTLHMSLSGIRDMSLIDDPPEGRLPIKTYVKEFDDELIREVVLRELDRGGQVYYLHNRIESISHIAEHLRRLIPQAKVEIAHGQMHEDDLEDIMLRFAQKDFNILVCTTIVESGLDIPNVNTIIVEDADRLGLSQLYQLRGRVGRSKKQGYAYLLYRKDKQLTEVAERRLDALREFSDLGSGYKVAMRDLEIRGAGNLLGAEQSGTVASVGFDLYTQLLSQAINELRGDEIEPDFEMPNVSLPLDANIPERYIPSEPERILMYKKLAAVRNREHVDRIQEELEDRYGDPPRAVWNLLAILRLRLRCKELGIASVVAEKRRVAVRFAHGTHLPMDAIRKLARNHMQHQFLPDVVFLAVPETPSRLMGLVEDMIEVVAKALPANQPAPAQDPAPRTTLTGAPRTPAPRPATRR